MPLQIISGRPAPASKPHALLLLDILFELLPHLDFCSLLTCQRVCRTWASAISRSRDAQQRLFLVSDDRPFEAFKAAEEHDIATKAPAAFDMPSQRIILRPEFRNLFNPWMYITTENGPSFSGGSRKANKVYRWSYRIAWRFTNRICSGYLHFTFSSEKLLHMANEVQASWLKMFLTQPPIKRVLFTVQVGHIRGCRDFDIEKAEGVRIGDLMARLRGSDVIAIFEETMGTEETMRTESESYVEASLRFDEHFEGIRFMPRQQLVEDEHGTIIIRTIP